MSRTDKKKYSSHKSSAKFRGIDFLLTFEEWYDIWKKSGYYAQRGVGSGSYVMSRYNDVGPYSVGNVFIQSNAQNVIDAKGTGRRKGSTFSEEIKQLFSEQRTGVLKSTEWKQNLSLSQIGISKPQQIVSCPHCEKEGALNNMKRWHFANCKEKV